MEEEKKLSKLDELKSIYSFDSGSPRWIPRGGDLLKYIGQDVVYVEFRKDETGDWTSWYENAKIIDMRDYDSKTMTYEITYWTESMKGNETKTIRIIPEGFSVDITGAGVQDSMVRFVPRSLHCILVETETFYKRLEVLYAKRDTMSVETLKEISEVKDQSILLNYARNLVLLTKTVDNYLLHSRIVSLKLVEKKDGSYTVTLIDELNRVFGFDFTKENKKYKLVIDTEVIGDTKIIDLVS